MSSDSNKTHESLSTPTESRAQLQLHVLSTEHQPTGGPPSSDPESTEKAEVTGHLAGLTSPPKLIRFPTIVLTPVDAPAKSTKVLLPPPPPLIKMPVFSASGREKRSIVASKNSSTTPEAEDGRGEETPKKRARTCSESGGTPPTRKIIQEIFGPDKSKRSKGKGRKRRRAPPTPRKKAVVEQEEDEVEDIVKEEPEEVDDEEQQLVEEKDIVDESDIVATDDGTAVLELDIDTDNLQNEGLLEGITEEEVKKEEENMDDETVETASVASSTREGSRRKAKDAANEKLRKTNQNTAIKDDDSNDDVSEAEVPAAGVSAIENLDIEEAAEIQSRRSTTETSSKSSSSVAQPDSDCSRGNENIKPDNDRQRDNPTPFSMISEDDDQNIKDEEQMDGISVSDMQDQKDSDVDSTYSWKPVRVAAALAMEQVTKKQGGSSNSNAGDTVDTKSTAAAERRARKILRYKGRSRRTLLFKSSRSKQFTKARTRYSAQPSILPVVYHHGSHFQTGDIGSVELENGEQLFGQIKGIMMDASGEISAGLRWLAPKCTLYSMVEFNPRNYAPRYDIPEKLIKIGFVSFVMHLSMDYFDGQPTFNKIEKGTIYTRIGKSLYGYIDEEEAKSGSGSSSEDDDSSKDMDDDDNAKQSGHDDKYQQSSKTRDVDSENDTTDVEDDDDKEVAQCSEHAGDVRKFGMKGSDEFSEDSETNRGMQSESTSHRTPKSGNDEQQVISSDNDGN